MKKFLNVIKRNIFYIALIAGMVALVGLVALYNVKTQSDDENAVSSEAVEETADRSNLGTTEAVKETLGGTAKAENKTEATTEKSSEVETGANAAKAEEQIELNYDGSTALMWPLNGNVIIPFSMDTTVFYETLNQYKCNAGIVLEAAENDKVSAAYKCKITEITSTPEFGNVVKASLGNGYEVMYGQLKDINVSVGQVVDAGCTIGTVAEPSRYYSKEGTNRNYQRWQTGRSCIIDRRGIIRTIHIKYKNRCMSYPQGRVCVCFYFISFLWNTNMEITVGRIRSTAAISIA